MAKIYYHKLVRDNIPEIMTSKGKAFEAQTMSDEQVYTQALLEKLVEESKEAGQAQGKEELIKELADLQEVILAVEAQAQITPEEVEAVRSKRFAERGGFAKKVFLVWGESD